MRSSFAPSAGTPAAKGRTPPATTATCTDRWAVARQAPGRGLPHRRRPRQHQPRRRPADRRQLPRAARAHAGAAGDVDCHPGTHGDQRAHGDPRDPDAGSGAYPAPGLDCRSHRLRRYSRGAQLSSLGTAIQRRPVNFPGAGPDRSTTACRLWGAQHCRFSRITGYNTVAATSPRPGSRWVPHAPSRCRTACWTSGTLRPSRTAIHGRAHPGRQLRTTVRRSPARDHPTLTSSLAQNRRHSMAMAVDDAALTRGPREPASAF